MTASMYYQSRTLPLSLLAGSKTVWTLADFNRFGDELGIENYTNVLLTLLYFARILSYIKFDRLFFSFICVCFLLFLYF